MKKYLLTFFALSLSGLAIAHAQPANLCASSVAESGSIANLVLRDDVSISSIFEIEVRSHLLDKTAGVPIADLATTHLAQTLIASGSKAKITAEIKELSAKLKDVQQEASSIGVPSVDEGKYSRPQLGQARRVLAQFKTLDLRLANLRSEAKLLNEENQKLDKIHSEMVGLKKISQDYLKLAQEKKAELLSARARLPLKRFEPLLTLINHDIGLTSQRLEAIETLIQDSGKKQIENVILIDQVLATADINFAMVLVSSGLQDDAAKSLANTAILEKSKSDAFKAALRSSRPYRAAMALVRRPVISLTAAGALIGTGYGIIELSPVGGLIQQSQQWAYARSVAPRLSNRLTFIFETAGGNESRTILLKKYLDERNQISFDEAYYIIENMPVTDLGTPYKIDELDRYVKAYTGESCAANPVSDGTYDASMGTSMDGNASSPEDVTVSPSFIFANRVLWMMNFSGVSESQKKDFYDLFQRRLQEAANESGWLRSGILLNYYQIIYSHRANGTKLEKDPRVASQPIGAGLIAGNVGATPKSLMAAHPSSPKLHQLVISSDNGALSLADFVGQQKTLSTGDLYELIDHLPTFDADPVFFESVDWLSEVGGIDKQSLNGGSMPENIATLREAITKADLRGVNGPEAKIFMDRLSKQYDAMIASDQNSDAFKKSMKVYLQTLLSRRLGLSK